MPTQLNDKELTEHDQFFLELLKDAPTWEVTKQRISSNTHEPSPDIRFSLANETKTRWITVGASLVTTTSPFGFGKPVISFFSFYHFRPSTDAPTSLRREYLYNSELYIWGPDTPKAFKNTWWNRLAKMTNDWHKSCTSGVQFMAKSGENPVILEQALIACVLQLARENCPGEFLDLLKMKVD